jgi:outer membrane protein assembly factor BamB
LSAHAESWSRFRGPNGQGIAENATPPLKLDPNRNRVWVAEVPESFSSPVLWGDRLFTTGLEDDLVVLVALNKQSGEQEWRAVLDNEITFMDYRKNGDHLVAPTPAVGPDRIYVYSFHNGLTAYDHEGNLKWNTELRKPVTMYCPGTSPVLHQGRIYICLDEFIPPGAKKDLFIDPTLCAFEAATGKAVWKTPRPFSGGGFSTPVVWSRSENGATKEELIVNGGGRLAAYALDDGELNWWVSGLPNAANTSPIVAGDLLFASATSGLGISDSGYTGPDWEDFIKYDKDEDGQVDLEDFPIDLVLASRPELPSDTPGYGVFPYKVVAKMSDQNKDGLFTKNEYDSMVEFVTNFSKPALLGVQPDGQGDLTESAVKWKATRSIPETPSMLLYQNQLYSVKDGGFLTSYDADTGDEIYKERLGAGSLYTASPVAADGRIYFCSARGVVTVVKAGKTFEVLSQSKLDEKIYGTPALENDRLFLRTLNRVHVFKEQRE